MRELIDTPTLRGGAVTRVRLAYQTDLVDRPARPNIGDRYLKTLAIVLMGYAIFGRAFAYVGFPPVFIGELMVLFGLVMLLSTPRWVRMFRTSQAVLLLPFAAWGLLRTVPYIKEYQIDALRDAVLWGYSIFAFYIAAVLLAEPTRINRLFVWYDRFAKVLLLAVPFIWVAAHFAEGAIPSLPWADGVSLISVKEGDMLVQMAGILAFWASGLGPKITWRWIILMTLDVGIAGVSGRGGLMAFLFVLVVCFTMRPRSLTPWRLGSIVFAGMLILAITGVNIEVPGGKERNISFDQFIENVFSVGKSSQATGLDNTKEWRMKWWTEIIDYTVHGPYFWTGKGYGINLADDDGFQVNEDASLRSPHNVHMTYLARSGVPGVTLWVLVNIVWGLGIAWGHLTAKRRDRQRWASLFLFVGCFWAAFLINASFDVYLEGPMGGIWFWTVYGLGFACLWMYKKSPEALTY